MMHKELRNEYGCSLENQDGRMAVRDFDAVIARLSPELRAAFEAERAARRAELEALRAVAMGRRRARVGRIVAALNRRGHFRRIFRRIREVGSVGLLAKPVLQMIARHRSATRREAGGQNICEGVRSEADLAVPTAVNIDCAPARRQYRRWPRWKCGCTIGCDTALAAALWRLGRHPDQRAIGRRSHVVDIKFIPHDLAPAAIA